jgi:hypothetical protein
MNDDYAKQIMAEADRIERDPYASERQTLTGEAAKQFLAQNGYQPEPLRAGTMSVTGVGTPRVDRKSTVERYDLPVLNEREGTHGDYGKTAETAQGLKRVMYDARTLPTAAMRESIDLICTKLARIANGNPCEPDHWRDIAGYATLVADRLEREG